jgi:hypothetical protein
MAVTRVVDPDDGEWTVRRRWVHRRLRWRGPGGSFDLMNGADLAGAGADLPVVGLILGLIALFLFAIAAVLFIVPAVIFLVELLIVVTIVGIGVLGRLLFGRPWTVEAHQHDADHTYEWKVRGWRASSELVHSIAEQLHTTGEPAGGTRTTLAAS